MTSNKPIDDILQPIAKSSAAKWSYISLFYSLFYAFPVVLNFQHHSLSDLVIIALVYLVFLVLFFTTVRLVGSKAAIPISLLILLGGFSSSINTGANVLFGYAAFFSGYYFKRRFANLLLSANLLVQLISAYVFELLSIYYLGPGLALSLSLFIYGAFTRKDMISLLNNQRQNEQIESLAAIAERERIARDMHDLLGHSLSSLALKSELAQKLIDRGDSVNAQQEIAEVANIARKTLAEVREAVTGLKKQSLQAGLASLVDNLQNLGFSTRFEMTIPPLPAKLESTLLMLCKEWVTNILRHSNGDEVSIVLQQSEHSVILKIKDNGTAKTIRAGNGINGMQSRVAELEGELKISNDKGVELQLALPLARNP